MAGEKYNIDTSNLTIEGENSLDDKNELSEDLQEAHDILSYFKNEYGSESNEYQNILKEYQELQATTQQAISEDKIITQSELELIKKEFEDVQKLEGVFDRAERKIDGEIQDFSDFSFEKMTDEAISQAILTFNDAMSKENIIHLLEIVKHVVNTDLEKKIIGLIEALKTSGKSAHIMLKITNIVGEIKGSAEGSHSYAQKKYLNKIFGEGKEYFNDTHIAVYDQERGYEVIKIEKFERWIGQTHLKDMSPIGLNNYLLFLQNKIQSKNKLIENNNSLEDNPRNNIDEGKQLAQIIYKKFGSEKIIQAIEVFNLDKNDILIAELEIKGKNRSTKEDQRLQYLQDRKSAFGGLSKSGLEGLSEGLNNLKNIKEQIGTLGKKENLFHTNFQEELKGNKYKEYGINYMMNVIEQLDPSNTQDIMLAYIKLRNFFIPEGSNFSTEKIKEQQQKLLEVTNLLKASIEFAKNQQVLKLANVANLDDTTGFIKGFDVYYKTNILQGKNSDTLIHDYVLSSNPEANVMEIAAKTQILENELDYKKTKILLENTDLLESYAQGEIKMEDIDSFIQEQEVKEIKEYIQKQKIEKLQKIDKKSETSVEHKKGETTYKIDGNNFNIKQTNNNFQIIADDSKKPIFITPIEAQFIQKNPNALKNLLDFNEKMNILGLSFVWQYRSDLINSMRQGIKYRDINHLDGNNIDKSELNKLLNYVLALVGEKGDDANFSTTYAKTMEINESGGIGDGKRSVISDYGVIGQTMSQKGYIPAKLGAGMSWSNIQALREAKI